MRCDVVQVERCGQYVDVTIRNDAGVLIGRHGEVFTDEFEKYLRTLLTKFQPCAGCGDPIPVGDCDRCDGCIVASFEPDYDALAALEQVSQYQDALESAELVGVQ